MNSQINLGSGGVVLPLLAAASILAYGVWSGRRDLGMRGALGVLGASLLSAAPVLILTNLGWTGPVLKGAVGVAAATLGLLLTVSTVLLLNFMPLYVAVNWMEVIRSQARRG